MANLYRVKQAEPGLFVVEMSTVSGWISCANQYSLEAAVKYIRAKREVEEFKVKYFDMDGVELPSN